MFNVPLPNRYFTLFFFRQIFAFWDFLDIWILRDPTFSAGEKKNIREGLGRGTLNTCAKLQGLISQKRRGHLDFSAVNVQKSRLRLVIAWFQRRLDFGR